jgi:ankyrin repeat protein
LELLLSNAAAVKEQDLQGRVPIHRAAELGNIECVKLLILADSVKNQKCHAGSNSFDFE